ncbi:CUB domain-containing protein isoform X2 [Pyxicephalus adspersus]|uniref:CUB domain-containing protein isoform X2 n=1 Tax=Pyxicephalus adspersus TaxID=30357 RepID=UPI003B5C50A6
MKNLAPVTVADTFPDKCGEVLTDHTGVISNLFYPPNFWCEWIIKAEPGKVVELSFTYIKMIPELNCPWGAVTIYDGYQGDNNKLARICKDTTKKFYSTSSVMTVLFVTDSDISGDKFEARYTIL